MRRRAALTGASTVWRLTSLSASSTARSRSPGAIPMLMKSAGGPSAWLAASLSSWCIPGRTMKMEGASSAHERPRPMNGKPMKRKTHPELTPEEQADLAALAALPDEAIDTSDAPEVPEWSDARRGLFYRPIKQQVTLRLDRDVL